MKEGTIMCIENPINTELLDVLKEIVKNHPPIFEPMGGVDPYKVERLYLKHANEAIKKAEEQ